MAETPGSSTVSTKLQRIAMLAKQAPDTALTTLSHPIDEDWLLEAYRRTRKDGARGVDGQDAEQYTANLQENLQNLLERAKAGTYHAPPVRRVHIPKGDGPKTRPIGCQHSRTKCCSARLPWCWRRSMSRIFWTARMASDPDDRRTKRYDCCGTRR